MKNFITIFKDAVYYQCKFIITSGGQVCIDHKVSGDKKKRDHFVVPQESIAQAMWNESKTILNISL